MYRHKMSRASGRALGDPVAVTETTVPIAATAPDAETIDVLRTEG